MPAQIPFPEWWYVVNDSLVCPGHPAATEAEAQAHYAEPPDYAARRITEERVTFYVLRIKSGLD